ncbi:hypothetical protein TNCV_1279331 [Trichonephila clavipes]|nr:hypothetical protein TNCV_1279331 [Trichonephila clavipes]
MARKQSNQSQTIQRRGRETPDRNDNPERPPSTSTESFRSISPLLEETSRMMTVEPKDQNLPSSNDTSRPVTPQDTTCRERIALTEAFRNMKSAINTVRNIIHSYKEQGKEPHSILIQDQLQL